MRQSIQTKYIGPTNARGSRVSAISASGARIVIEWDDALNTDENHKAAAMALARKLNWAGTWHAGSTPHGCVFVQSTGDPYDSFTLGKAQRGAACSD
jgi:hypothetical protein